ncbi:MAG: homogentisate 1,2-dioxygenase, partial [Planctomycetota bacterium]
MATYQRRGEIPRKRHIKLPRDKGDSFLNEGLAYEHVVTTAGFDRAYSILYHLRPPTRVKDTVLVGTQTVEAAGDLPLRHHHFETNKIARGGDPITGRVPMLFNDDLIAYRCKPETEQAMLFRNGTADEIVFVFHGGGYVESSFGKLPYGPLDYIVLPRGTTYRMVPDDIAKEDYLVLETPGQYRLPPNYLNPDGQIKLGAPYCERDFHPPGDVLVIDDDSPTDILVKDNDRLSKVTMAHHPFDVIGWDGLIYPYTFNALDFEPLTGTTHLPPPFQTTFLVDEKFVVCTFAPRHLDHHPEAIKVPYVHSNVDADEVLFYCRGEFGSRKGIDTGSMTLHPTGIPHGPHPGTVEKSLGKTHTDELAVMCDTFRPMFPTKAALALDDPAYPESWRDDHHAPLESRNGAP